MDAALARMHHGDYVAEIAYEAASGLFRGHVINPERGVLDFWGTSIEVLRAKFAHSVRFYEESRRKAGREPEPPRPVGE